MQRALILSFSPLYLEEGFPDRLREQGEEFGFEDLSSLEGTSCYCSGEAAEKIAETLSGHGEKLRWIDTGDYHYVSYLFAKSVGEEFSLLLLDNHPDDQEAGLGDILSCGGWVKALRERNPNLREVYWNSVEDIPEGETVYVSLDKDLMGREYSRTDWSQGEWTLSEVEDALREVVRKGCRILAVDVCGGVTFSKGATPEDMRINLVTDTRLYEFLKELITT